MRYQYRIVGIYTLLLCLFLGMCFRLSSVSSDQKVLQTAQSQGASLVRAVESRGNIYDRNLTPLVNCPDEDHPLYRAAVAPSSEALNLLSRYYDPQKLLTLMRQGKPFAITLEKDMVYGKGIEIFPYVSRYSENQLAPHIIGYINGAGEGVSGVELAFNDYLKDTGRTVDVRFQTDGVGTPFAGIAPEVEEVNADSREGLILTLDSRIQTAAEQAMSGIAKGAAVVMDVETGDLLASVSAPAFQPTNLTASLEDSDAPFVNRAFSAYNVGSTFKLVVAARALEVGISPEESIVCTGTIEVGGQTFPCHFAQGHGETNMLRGLEWSCNPYFIHLIQEIGGEGAAILASDIGFGRADVFCEGYKTAAGYLPAKEEFQNPAAEANFGFGQGTLMATPVQIAKLISCIANGGEAVQARLIQGYAETDGSVASYTPRYSRIRVMSERTAALLKEYMIAVVESGSGQLAKPDTGGAGGKTASAQTGQYSGEGDERKEKVDAWFSGFYPAANPKYAIVVLAEGMESGSDYAAPVFQKIANAIAQLE